MLGKIHQSVNYIVTWTSVITACPLVEGMENPMTISDEAIRVTPQVDSASNLRSDDDVPPFHVPAGTEELEIIVSLVKPNPEGQPQPEAVLVGDVQIVGDPINNILVYTTLDIFPDSPEVWIPLGSADEPQVIHNCWL